MTLSPLPLAATEFMGWSWPQIEPYFQELERRALNAQNVTRWLADWSRLTDLLSETYTRLYVATTVNTADEAAARRYRNFLETIYPASQSAEQRLKEKMLASGLTAPGFEIPLRNMRAEADLFRAENLPLLAEEHERVTEYEKIMGAQTVMWEGRELTVAQMSPMFQNPDRSVRERAWRLVAERQLADREAINALWREFLRLRRRLAANAGFDNYRDFRWKQMLRFDYTPDDTRRFHDAIEQAVVPATARLYEKGRQRLGLERLRPWDLLGQQGFRAVVEPPDLPPLHTFKDVSDLEACCAAVFQHVDPQLGEYFEAMRREGLLDLANRKNKAPGGYCVSFEATRRPFIFANAVGIHADVSTLLHEGGHAFHAFEMRRLPYYQQRAESVLPMEFAEVASMGMELLAAPYLASDGACTYSEADAARALRQALEEMLFVWPYMAVVDAFQQWVYENIDAAMEPANCDAQWQALWRRFMVGVDWSGLEEVSMTRWHRQPHIHTTPLYYVEYALAQLGAVQVWRNARVDQAGAVANYRRALALGATTTLPQLYATAGAKFAFDAQTLGEAVALMEQVISELDR